MSERAEVTPANGGGAAAGPRERVRALVESPAFQWVIIVAILINAAILGIETYTGLLERWEHVLVPLGRVTLALFIVEITLRIYAYGKSFFTDAWGIFDFVVVVIALIPASGAAGVLRILRVLRVLRLLSTVRTMKRVVQALVATVPGMASIGALVLMLLYVSAVVSTQLFSDIDEQHFGSLHNSLLSLFQIMSGDDWANIIRPVTDQEPWAWLFFLVFVVIGTYIVLNLFIAVAVEALEDQSDSPDGSEAESADVAAALRSLQHTVDGLRAEVAALTANQEDPPNDRR